MRQYAYTINWLGFVIIPLWFGLHKFFDPLYWQAYLSPQIAQVLPFSITTLFYTIGAIETLVGIMVLTKRFRQLFAGIAVIWLLLISVNLFWMGLWDLAVRDVAIAALAFNLACKEPQ